MAMSKKYYEERICVICKKEFYIPKSKRNTRHPSGIRSRNSLTCSSKCSKQHSKNLNIGGGKNGKSTK